MDDVGGNRTIVEFNTMPVRAIVMDIDCESSSIRTIPKKVIVMDIAIRYQQCLYFSMMMAIERESSSITY